MDLEDLAADGRTQRERMLAGDLYIADDPQLAAESRRAMRLTEWEAAEPISIHDNVWLGGGAVVLAGVTVGENTVVGAGAVVTKDLPADVVAVGNPARVVRHL